MLLLPGQAVNHPCGMQFKNATADPVDFPNSICPKCSKPIADQQVIREEIVKWTLMPPPGFRFVNELGGGVTIQFPKGQETELFQVLTARLHELFQSTLRSPATLPAAQEIPIPMTIDDDGSIVEKH